MLQFKKKNSELLGDDLLSSTTAVGIKVPAMLSKTGSIEDSTRAQILIRKSLIKCAGYNIQNIHRIIQRIIPKSDKLK